MSKDNTESNLLLFESVHAGFPSPAEDIPGRALDLSDLLIKNPESTFFARVSGDSMTGDGIDDGDILIIDKSEEPVNGSVAICFIDGEFTVKKLSVSDKGILLLPSNKKYPPIKIDSGSDFVIWGIVKYVIKKL